MLAESLNFVVDVRFNTRQRGLHPLRRLPRRVIEDRLAERRRLLRQSTTHGRAVLQRILRGQIVFKTPCASREWRTGRLRFRSTDAI
jgi:hypothetical protein